MAHNHGLLQKLLYGLTGLGHQSVMVFFVLSGYLVGGSVLSAGNRFNWRDFLLARLSRLWVVMLPCLALTLLADSLTAMHAEDVLSGAYAARWHSAPAAGSYSASFLTLLGNIAFVQTIFVPVFGSNGPLWSLANEFWYYMLFPLAMAACGQAGARSIKTRGASLAGFILILVCLTWEIRLGFVVWLLGALVSHIHRNVRLSLTWFSVVVATLCLGGALVFSKFANIQGWPAAVSDLILGVAVAGFLLCVIKAGVFCYTPPAARLLSDISFSLYLSHFPLVILASAYLFHDASLQPSGGAWLSFAGLLLCLLVTAWALWWSFEKRTPSVKKFLGKILARATAYRA